jgi:hypothetical protein
MAEKNVPLIVVGAPVVTYGDEGGRMQLEGGATLTDEQRQTLGEPKVASLHRSGYLQTQEQLDEAEARRQQLEANRLEADVMNPNYGTPSMTPEVLEQLEQERAEKSGDRKVLGPAELTKRPVADLDVNEATLAAIHKHGFKTVGDILAFGEKNVGLAGKVDGIGEARETEIKEAISTLAKK